MRKLSYVLSLACAVVLVGCLVPERFKADVTVQANGDCEFHYDGTVVNAMAAAKKKQAARSRKKMKPICKEKRTKLPNAQK